MQQHLRQEVKQDDGRQEEIDAMVTWDWEAKVMNMRKHVNSQAKVFPSEGDVAHDPTRQ